MSHAVQLGTVEAPRPRTRRNEQVATARGERERGNLAAAAALLDDVLVHTPNDAPALAEKVAFCLHTYDTDGALIALARLVRCGGEYDPELPLQVATIIHNRSQKPQYVAFSPQRGVIAPGWLSITAGFHVLGTAPEPLSSHMRVPVEDESVEITYCNDVVGLLDAATTLHVIHETRRILNARGYLVIKYAGAIQAEGESLLRDALESSGLHVLSNDRARIVKRFYRIPHLGDAQAEHAYLVGIRK